MWTERKNTRLVDGYRMGKVRFALQCSLSLVRFAKRYAGSCGIMTLCFVQPKILSKGTCENAKSSSPSPILISPGIRQHSFPSR